MSQVNDVKYAKLIELGYSGQLTEMEKAFWEAEGEEWPDGNEARFAYYAANGGTGSTFNELEETFWRDYSPLTITAGTDPTYTESKVFSVVSGGTEVYRVQQGNYNGTTHDYYVTVKPLSTVTDATSGHSHGNQNYNVSPWFAACALGTAYVNLVGFSTHLGRMHSPVDSNMGCPFAWSHYASGDL